MDLEVQNITPCEFCKEGRRNLERSSKDTPPKAMKSQIS